MAFESVAREEQIDVGAILSALVRRLPRILLVTLLLLAITYVIVLFMPRLYESSASILVEPRSNVYVRSANEQAPTITGAETGVVSSQIELLRSRDTLMRVIDELDLRDVPEFNGVGDGSLSPLATLGRLLGRGGSANLDETVLNNLYARLNVAQERDSRIISVGVMSTDPELAARIANSLANAHVERRAELSLTDTARASEWLAEEIERLRVAVVEAETAVADFKVANDLYVGGNNTTLLDQQLSTLAGQINAAQERRTTALSRASLIRGLLQQGESVEGIPGIRDSVSIQQLSQQKAQLQAEMAQRSATLLPNHPTMRALAAQISELTTQINAEARRIADAIEAEAEVEAGTEASLREQLSGLKASASTATTDNVTLDSLEREAKAQRDLLESYLLRYNEANSRTETSSTLPDVRVVSVAAPSVVPASPKTSLILAAVGFVSIAVQAGAVIFGELMSGRAVVAVNGYERPQDELEEVPFDEEDLEPDQRWQEPVDVVEVEPEEYPPAAAEISAEQPEWNGDPAITDHEPEPGAADEAVRAALEDDPGAPEDDAVVPETDPMEPEAVAATASITGLLSTAQLSSDLVLGRTHLLMLAGAGLHDTVEKLAEALSEDALARGLSVALIDAGSARRSEEPGLTDLARGVASFGDVVHKSADNSFAEVPWGRLAALDLGNTRPLTLVEALGDIYEVVIVNTGMLGPGTPLSVLAELGGRLVLVPTSPEDVASLATAREGLRDVGFDAVEIAAPPAQVAA
ncbi:Wzz/FepE/Etk N-terminal domain-containing protein [Devosia albogilva]|uniref:Wzz/FepE/Etk N-terminal domain-containing protein n=1 Tax=Devosia albogilva TaxID=429726 RepID=A0ABW5QF81_9HYPH